METRSILDYHTQSFRRGTFLQTTSKALYPFAKENSLTSSSVRRCFFLFAALVFLSSGSVSAASSAAKKWFQRGEKARIGTKGKHDWATAYLAYQKACKRRHPRACWRQGQLRQVYLSRQSSRTLLGQKNKSARELYKKACRLGSHDGCVSWARALYQRGRRFQRRARRLLRKLCHRKKHGVACFQWVEWLPKRARQRQRRKTRLTLFRQLSTQCHQRHEEACYVLGVLHFKGTWLRQSSLLANRFFTRSCKLQYADACDFLGLMYGTGRPGRRNLAKARQYHRLACELYAPEGCLHLGGLLLRGLGGPKEHHTARRLFRRTCHWNVGQGCILFA